MSIIVHRLLSGCLLYCCLHLLACSEDADPVLPITTFPDLNMDSVPLLEIKQEERIFIPTPKIPEMLYKPSQDIMESDSAGNLGRVDHY